MPKRYFSLIRSLRRESGAAFIETAIIIPMMIPILVSLFELGRLIFNYMLLSHVAYEAARAASQMALLDEGCYKRIENQITNHGVESDGGLVGHYLVQQRAAVMATNVLGTYLNINHEVDGSKIAGPKVGSMYIHDHPQVIQECGHQGINEKDVVGVRLEGNYQPLLWPFELPISAERRAPYLSNNEPTLTVGAQDSSSFVESMTKGGGKKWTGLNGWKDNNGCAANCDN